MTNKRAKELGYTHEAEMYGIRGYYNGNEDAFNTFQPKWIVTDWLFEIILYIDVFYFAKNRIGFPITIIKEL